MATLPLSESDGIRSRPVPDSAGDFAAPANILTLERAAGDERVRLVQEWLDGHEDEELSSLLAPVESVSLHADGSFVCHLDLASFAGSADEGHVFADLEVAPDRSRWQWL